MKRTIFLGMLLIGLAAVRLEGANPRDAGSNPYTAAESVVTVPHAPPADPAVKIRFSNGIDSGPAARLANYSLRQTPPELGSGNPGGMLEDLDGDGDLDMVVSISPKIFAYKNEGTATAPRYTSESHELATVGFFNGSSFVATTSAVNVMFGDVDGDGDRDMICSEQADGQVTCFLRTNASTSWPGFSAQKKVLENRGTSKDLIQRSAETGGWITDVGIASVTMIDLNQDGHLDLVVGDPWHSWIPSVPHPNIFVYRGTGQVEPDGSPVFGPATPIKAGGNYIKLDIVLFGATCPAFMDLDGDGDLDLLISTTFGEIWTYKANGTDVDPASDNYGLPLFQAGELLADPSGQEYDFGDISALSVSDFSSDGDQDLVIVCGGGMFPDSKRVRVLENLGGTEGGFSGRPLTVGLGGFEGELRASQLSHATYFDFDADGKVDVMYGGNGYGLSIAYNMDTGDNHHPRFALPNPLPLPAGAVEALEYPVPVVADFDHDGILDAGVDGIVAGTSTDLLFLVYTGLSGGGLPEFAAPVSILPPGFAPLHFIEPTVGDVNGDGKLDVLCVTGSNYFGEDQNLLLMTNSSASQFALGARTVVLVDGAASSFRFPELADFDGDGHLDVLVAERDSATYGMGRNVAKGTLKWLKNDGSFGLSNQGLVEVSGGGPVSVDRDAVPRVINFDADGPPDLMLSSGTSAIRSFLASAPGPGITLTPASPTLKAVATLPSSALLSGSGKLLELAFPTIVQAGNYLDLNELYVGGERTAILNRQIQFNIDTDEDGLPDDWELLFLGGLEVSSGSQNSDGDWLTDLEEYQLGTNPSANDDTDMDGWLDREEIKALNLSAAAEQGFQTLGQLTPWGDADGDGYANAQEVAQGTNPFSAADPAVKAYAPLVEILPPDAPAGMASSRTNGGSIGGIFSTEGSQTTENFGPTSIQAIKFDPTKSDWLVGPKPSPWLAGRGSRTIAAWIKNEDFAADQDDIIVSWGGGTALDDDPDVSPIPALFSARFGEKQEAAAQARSALRLGGAGGLQDRNWGVRVPVPATQWSFVVFRYDQRTGWLMAMRDFEAGFNEYGVNLETGIFAYSGGKPVKYPMVIGGDNLRYGTTRIPTAKTGLTIGQLRIYGEALPFSEIVKYYNETRPIYNGVTEALVETALPAKLKTSLGWSTTSGDTDGDGISDLTEFDNGQTMDFFNGRGHRVTATVDPLVNGTVYRGGKQSSAEITYQVTDLKGDPVTGLPVSIPDAPMRFSVIGAPNGLGGTLAPVGRISHNGSTFAAELPGTGNAAYKTDAQGKIKITYRALKAQ